MEEIKMKTPEGEEIMVDEAMAPIVYLFWQHGIHTKFCCAGHLHNEGDAGIFQSYIVFTIDAAPYLYDAINVILDSTNKELRKFICRHFNISFDICQKSVTIEAEATTDESWMRIITIFYKIAENICPYKRTIDSKYVCNWIYRAHNCTSIYSECDEDAYPHIDIKFFIIDDDKDDEEELYFAMDREYAYSTCYTHTDVDITDDHVVMRPVITNPHNIDIDEDFLRLVEKPILRTEFIKLFGFDPLDQSE